VASAADNAAAPLILPARLGTRAIILLRIGLMAAL